MHYKFNPFSGRLSGSSLLGVVPSKHVQYAEAPTQQFILKTKLAVTESRPYKSSKYAPVPPHLLSKMKHFQIPNGLPVYIRGGPMDKVLYAITAAACLVGLVDCFKVYYELSYPALPQSE